MSDAETFRINTAISFTNQGVDTPVLVRYSIVKRSFDIVVATLLLTFTLPVMAISALMIALESRGPIIYRQTRVGHRSKNFTLLKFRSMAPDAEKEGSPSWASVNDARVTRFGRFITPRGQRRLLRDC